MVYLPGQTELHRGHQTVQQVLREGGEFLRVDLSEERDQLKVLGTKGGELWRRSQVLYMVMETIIRGYNLREF